MRLSDYSFGRSIAAPSNKLGLSGLHYRHWLARQSSKDLNWLRYILGIHDGIMGQGSSKLIHPLSVFTIVKHVLSSLLTVYSFIETPVIIAFYWNQDACFKPKTAEMGLALETSFIIEIILQFFTGYYDASGLYSDSIPAIAKMVCRWGDGVWLLRSFQYLRQGFLFDLVTSAPITWVEYFAVYNKCNSQFVDNSYIYAKVPLKLIRPLRLVKVLRLFRIAKVLALVHLYNCGFWLVKVVFDEHLDEFLLAHGLSPDPPAGEVISAQQVVERYVLSGYFINNLFTTVGFGDIAGTNTAERLFCIFTMWSGTMVFAVVVSETSDIVAKFNEQVHARKQRLQRAGSLTAEQEIRHFLQQNKEILDWSLFRCVREKALKCPADPHLKALVRPERVLPAPIQQKLSLELDQGLIGSLPFFELIQDIEVKEKLISMIGMQIPPRLAAAGQQVEMDENSSAQNLLALLDQDVTGLAAAEEETSNNQHQELEATLGFLGKSATLPSRPLHHSTTFSRSDDTELLAARPSLHNTIFKRTISADRRRRQPSDIQVAESREWRDKIESTLEELASDVRSIASILTCLAV
ncbi:hypothetical protein GUITHDRAFT_142925 [Guillardia theta CCMP2712]|uniref:Potassium channel domain-containing protein n=1 Tax=Guillardia theta (strain CCMP2712) TaxID=905079 RepID=L1IVR5_GUITC|nr:hypothetical protein GUITHDRAFT_142925 [Guillardia theta CCMP2712]EKX40202.1 hypothetical protein GUITHDRAFT_142925 [Guillardia theta CCMP2712]|eukprot:XP_005827182.1 hypothetical protein GUITHDRAFT_142925 [Guillardia theta CCMP2712]